MGYRENNHQWAGRTAISRVGAGRGKTVLILSMGHGSTTIVIQVVRKEEVYFMYLTVQSRSIIL